MFANSKFPLVQISTFLHRNKTQIKIQNNETYKRVTIKTKGQGCHLRDTLKGSLIGTKNQFLIKEGQFLISKIDARNGAFGVVSQDIHNAIITGNFWTYDIDTSKVNAYFLALFTSTKYFIDFCKACSGGTTGRHYLDENKFLNAKIPLPPLKIQKQIVAKIESIKAQIKALQVEEKRLKDEIEAYIYIALGLEKKQEAQRQKVFIVRFKDLDRWNTRHNQSIAINLCHTDSTPCHTDTTSTCHTNSPTHHSNPLSCHTEAIAEVSTNIESKFVIMSEANNLKTIKSKRDFDTLSLRGEAKAFHNPQNNIKADFTESMDCHDFATQNLAMTGLDLKALLDSIPTPPKEGWEVKTLGEICEKITDGTHKTPKYELSGIPFLSIQNISKGYFDLSNVKYISQDEHNNLSKRCNPKLNDILFCRIGTLGKAIKNTLNFDFSIFVSLALIRLKDESMVDYVVNVLNCGYIADWINENKVNGVHTSKINLNTLHTLPIPIPPLSVQEKIVTHIQKIESSIAATQEKIKALELELERYIESTL
ncbi:restriction endonuclease subunit S [Helicobacter canis]|nr:restriction endonuclease subunit S [Helicobacter canis]